MSDSLLEFLVLGQIPGTDIVLGFRTSLLIAGVFCVFTCTYLAAKYRSSLKREFKALTPAKLIDLKTI